MATSKATSDHQMNRQQPKRGSKSGKAKAATITFSSTAKQAATSYDCWHDAIQKYCDYFIRY